MVMWRATGVVAEMRQDRLAAAAYQRGVAFQLERRYDEAATAFRAALTISPRATAAYTALGDVEFRQGHTDEAVWAYRQLIATYPYAYVAELHRQIGLFELRGGLFAAAGQDLQQAVALDPQDWVAFHWLGHAYYRLGDFRSARGAWEHALSLNPDFSPAHDQLRELDAQHR
jgi:tetratricopeptide (TPR) repeat protein